MGLEFEGKMTRRPPGMSTSQASWPCLLLALFGLCRVILSPTKERLGVLAFRVVERVSWIIFRVFRDQCFWAELFGGIRAGVWGLRFETTGFQRSWTRCQGCSDQETGLLILVLCR